MKKLVPIALGLALVAALAAGCGKSNPSQPQELTATPTPQDIAQVNDAVAASPEYVDENVYESNDPMQLDADGSGMAAIRPLYWWRTIRSVTRSYDVAYTNPDSTGRPLLAVVTIHKRLLGGFHILAGDSTAVPSSLVRKPLDDRWERRLLLRREPRNDSTGIVIWRLVGTSGVKVTSAEAGTHIQSVRVQAGVLDTTITAPLEMHRLRRVLHIPTGTQVVLTVKTTRDNDVVLLYRWMHRARFHNDGGGQYTIRWTTGNDGGLRHFGVNALSHGTLYDDAAPYDSQAWIFPFVVHDADDHLGG
ncbi:MAG: hypothetical protein IT347_12195 [Candidatus Eisenbacteria bacterium]|nr:hypothetical protein [Candidatus Eisenbacteria bacterium]